MAKQGNIKGWFTINGVHVPILDGESKGSSYKKFIELKNKKDKPSINKKSMKVLSREEYSKIRTKEFENNNKVEEEYKKTQEELKQKLEQNKISYEEYDKMTLDAYDKYNKERLDTISPYVMDTKNNQFMLLDKDTIFEDKSKKFNSEKASNNLSKLTDGEKQALTDYTSQYGYGSYSNINGLLYDPDKAFYGGSEVKGKVQEATKQIDSAMNKCTLGQNCQVYRGIEASKLNNEKVAKAINRINTATKKGTTTGLDKNIKELESLKGTTIENKAFMSTSVSYDPNYAKRDVTLIINAKSSDKAIHIQSLSKYGGKQDTSMVAFSKGGIQSENEILFNRNTNLKIVDVAVTKNGVQLLCDTE